jgi:hypothetical protein
MLKAVITVEYTHEVDGERKKDTIDIERQADRKAYTPDAFKNYVIEILKREIGAVKPEIVSITQPRPLIGL